MRKLNQILIDLNLKEIFKDVISNTITGLLLLYLGGLEPINQLIRKVTKPLNGYDVVIFGRVSDGQKYLRYVDVLIPGYKEGVTNEDGTYAIKIKFYKDDRDLILKYELKNHNEYSKTLEIKSLIDKDSIELKEVVLTPSF